uniref:Methyltransferase type 11 domain-containing protein n=1 Tax=Photinus pyralis TaxID=7054 RepID=A0A1Y1MW85_PHOPY
MPYATRTSTMADRRLRFFKWTSYLPPRSSANISITLSPSIAFTSLASNSKCEPARFLIPSVFRSALKNIYQMLKPGGDFFFTCVVQCDLFQVIATIFDDPKWRPYTSDNRQYMSPYQYSPHYIGDLERMLREVGFDVSFIAAEPREYDYPMRSVGDVLLSVYSMNISKHLEGEFEIVARRAIREVGCSRIKGGEEFYHTKFQVLFGHARRPTGG